MSDKASQDRISEKVVEQHSDQAEHAELGPGPRVDIEEEPVVTFKTWIVVTVNTHCLEEVAMKQLLTRTHFVRFCRLVMVYPSGRFQ